MLISGDLKNRVRNLFCSIFMLCIALSAQAQNQIPAVRISLDVNDRLEVVIKSIEEKSGISFSFNPNRIPVNQTITYRCEGKLLEQVLKEVLAPVSVTFEFIQGTIVLRPSNDKSPDQARRITLSGFITDASNGEALIGATIFFPELAVGAISNPFGFYSVTVPIGNHQISCSYVGYQNLERKVDLDLPQTMDFSLTPSPPLLDEIVVTESILSNRLESPQTSTMPIRPVTISQRPSFFGEADAVKSLEMVPGVKIHSDGSTFYYVRGGDKDQNLVLVDDAPVFNPNHLLGIFSTIIPEAINDLTLYKGAMPASLGGRLSSILDIRTKKGNDQRFQVSGGLGLISSKLTVEGPIKKDKTSFLLSGRRSRFKWITNAVDADINKFQFYDLTGKLNFDISSRNKLYVSFYNGSDDYFISNSGISWSNFAGSLRWNHLFSDRLFLNTTVAGGTYDYDLHTDLSNQSKWHSHLSNINIKSDFTYFKSPEQEIDFGLSLSGYNFNPGNFSSSQPTSFSVVSIRNSSELVLYGNHNIRINDKLGFNYGLRIISWSNLGDSFEFVYDQNRNLVDTLFFKKDQSYSEYPNVEPRGTVNYRMSEASSLKFSYARNVQNIHLISNSISPFTSFEVWLPSSINIKPQVANQLSVGYYRDLSGGIALEVEGFFKRMKNQIDYETHAETLLNPLFEGELRFGKARAYGVELLARKEQGKIRGVIGYSYSRAKRTFAEINEGRTYNAFYDRPHQVNVVFSYDASTRWNFGLNWNYSTGAPYSSPVSFYQYNDLEIPIYDQKNNSRLPNYHRMDVSATVNLNKNPENKFVHALTLSIYNVYGRKNTLFINYNKVEESENTFRVPANLLDQSQIITQSYLFRFTPSITYNFKWK